MAHSRGKKNLTATAEQLGTEASKSSVPISQGFFDNVASPSSLSLVANNLKTWAARQKHVNTQGMVTAS